MPDYIFRRCRYQRIATSPFASGSTSQSTIRQRKHHKGLQFHARKAAAVSLFDSVSCRVIYSALERNNLTGSFQI